MAHYKIPKPPPLDATATASTLPCVGGGQRYCVPVTRGLPPSSEPATWTCRATSYETFRTTSKQGASGVSVFRLRGDYRDLFSRQVAGLVAGSLDTEIEEETRYLVALLCDSL
jgi:hypothetical protein